jgi:hypothetical protein
MIYSYRTNSPRILLLLATMLISASFAVGQTQKSRGPGGAGGGGDEAAPLFHQYRNVRIGMTTEEVRKALNNPSDKSDEQDFFVFSENENAQVFYDKSKKVFAISVNFLNGAQDIPTPKAVFGSELPPKADGSMYKLVRYPKAGCWVSFSKTAGDSPLITVTLQKIE